MIIRNTAEDELNASTLDTDNDNETNLPKHTETIFYEDQCFGKTLELGKTVAGMTLRICDYVNVFNIKPKTQNSVPTSHL